MLGMEQHETDYLHRPTRKECVELTCAALRGWFSGMGSIITKWIIDQIWP